MIASVMHTICIKLQSSYKGYCLSNYEHSKYAVVDLYFKTKVDTVCKYRTRR